MIDRFRDASGFIFDCDGCLIDSMAAWRRVENHLIDASGIPFTQSMLEDMRAASIDEVARIFHQKYGVMESIEAILEYIADSMFHFYQDESALKPGAAAFVEDLRAHDIPCCVVSATPLRYLQAGLGHCGILDLFCDVLSTKETGISKQDPRIYMLALERMNALEGNAWGADDSLYALRVMNGCDISTIGTYDNDVAGSFDDLANTATIAIHSFEELL